MGSLTIRNLDSAVAQKLDERAASHGVTIEEEARAILRDAIMPEAPTTRTEWRLKRSREEILALGSRPARPFDLKSASDQMWDEGLL